MLRSWLILVHLIGRHALVAAGILAVLAVPMPVDCLPCVDAADAAHHGPAIAPDAGPGDPVDPEQCDHCHCTSPVAIEPDHRLQLPATLVSRNVAHPVSMRVPDDPVFVPDPPPNRA